LLASEQDENVFNHFATGQLARIDTESGTIERVGPAGLIASFSASPDQKYLLVGTVRRPFSYRVPFVYFTRKTEVWDTAGHPIATVADLPISDDIPRQGVPTGPRRAQWQPLHNARVVWTEALDGGDPRMKIPHRDKVMALAAPFSGKPVDLMKVQHRLTGFEWLPDRDHALVTEFDRDRRWRATALLDLAHPVDSRKVLFDLSVNDAYEDPGDPLTAHRPDGTVTILRDCDSIYLTGDGASPDGSRPFLDRLELKTGEKTRLFHCGSQVFENVLGFVGDSRSTILIRHQSKTEPVNYVTVDLQSGKRTQLTQFENPAPQLTRLKKELIKYQRDDGVPLSGTLYLPPDYKDGTRESRLPRSRIGHARAGRDV
jgi:dipeptidyl aminopeptidase/acylaminoacyl peptidase